MGLGIGQSKFCILCGGSHGSFSVPSGTRICLGEGIARSELFLFFTTILQNFSVSSPVAPKDIDITLKESGLAKIPPVYKISFLAHWLYWGSQVYPLLLRMAPCFLLWDTFWKPDPRSVSHFPILPNSPSPQLSALQALRSMLMCSV